MMMIIASLADPAEAARAQEQGAEIIELRFDLMGDDPRSAVSICRDGCSLPVIGTLRSAREGGQFFGDAGAWTDEILPAVPLLDYLDMEQEFAGAASRIHGTTIIASHHRGDMPTLPALFGLERDLRTYGGIVKIVVTPRTEEDVLELISFTHAARKPLCTGVMGARFRYARAILPLFGSWAVYCHSGTRTAEGQYSVEEFRSIRDLLNPGEGP